jgi:hypothetical protein
MKKKTPLKECGYEECRKLMPKTYRSGHPMTEKEYAARTYCNNDCSAEQRALVKARIRRKTWVKIELSAIDLFNAGRLKEITLN